MIKKFCILIFILVSIDSYGSKRDTASFKNSFAINLEALVFRDIKLTYTHRIDNKKYLDAMLSYCIPYSENSIVNDNYFWGLKDPFFYYGRVQVRAGLKKYFIRKNHTSRFYIDPMLLYSYGHFNKGDAWYVGDSHELVTRNKNDFEILFKSGWTFHRRHFLQDIYFGAGFRLKYLSDEVYEDMIEDSTYNLHPSYPYHSNHFYGVFTIHLGYQLGYCK